MVPHVEPSQVRLGHVPRVVQICVCGAVLIRGTKGTRAFYFWSRLVAGESPARVFRTEERAGSHCFRDTVLIEDAPLRLDRPDWSPWPELYPVEAP